MVNDNHKQLILTLTGFLSVGIMLSLGFLIMYQQTEEDKQTDDYLLNNINNSTLIGSWSCEQVKNTFIQASLSKGNFLNPWRYEYKSLSFLEELLKQKCMTENKS